MNIKIKLSFAFGLLFLLILIVGGVGIKYINLQKRDTANILKANYASLKYVQQMQLFLEKKDRVSLDSLAYYLKLQRNNVTEPGELDVTQGLQRDFAAIRAGYPVSEKIRSFQQKLFLLSELNLDAIKEKAVLAEENAHKATIWISFTAVLCICLALPFLISVPSHIANPIKVLSDSFREIAGRNYTKRVHLEEKDEFADLAHSFNRMAEKLQQYRESDLAQLLLEKKRIAALIDHMDDAVFGMDQQGVVLFVNPEAVHISGMSESELLGEELLHLSAKNDLLRELSTGFNPQAFIPQDTHTLKIFSHGKECYYEKHIIAIEQPSQDVQEDVIHAYLLILKNVTVFKEMDFAKTNFIANVSHELKTPIASLRMSLQLLTDQRIGDLNGDQQQLLQGMDDDAQRLLKITAELLNMTQIESGKINVLLHPTNVQEMIEYAISANKVQATDRAIRITCTLQNGVKDVLADMEKSAWVLVNLISNAVRYSYDHSMVMVEACVVDNKVVIAVKDEGQGISPEYLTKIFDRYFRVPGTRKAGTGLGLSISKEFMEAQGGRIWVSSELGIGSVFCIELPQVST